MKSYCTFVKVYLTSVGTTQRLHTFAQYNLVLISCIQRGANNLVMVKEGWNSAWFFVLREGPKIFVSCSFVADLRFWDVASLISGSLIS